MRIKLVMKDMEYSKALIKALRQYKQNIFVEIGEFKGYKKDCLIVTDYSPRNFSRSILNSYKGGIVFLLDKEVPERLKARERGPYFIFKYAGACKIFYELNLAYSLWSGDKSFKRKEYDLISIFSDFGDERSKYTSNMLGRQLAYRYGVKVLILPMSFLNNYSNSMVISRSDFLRLVYYIEERRVFSREVYFEKDNYDVEFLRLPSGINYLANLDEKVANRLLEFLGNNYFDFIILDFATAYTELAIDLIKESKYKIYVESGKNKLNIDGLLDDKANEVIKINWDSGKDSIAIKSEDLAIKIFDEKNDKRIDGKINERVDKRIDERVA